MKRYSTGSIIFIISTIKMMPINFLFFKTLMRLDRKRNFRNFYQPLWTFYKKNQIFKPKFINLLRDFELIFPFKLFWKLYLLLQCWYFLKFEKSYVGPTLTLKQQFQPTNINKTELLGLEHNDFKHLFFVFFYECESLNVYVYFSTIQLKKFENSQIWHIYT